MARGKLRIYLGAAPGVGKTYAMLSEAHRRIERGTDCVVAFVEHHHRPRTEVMLHGLEQIPRKELEYRDTTFTEMDVDAVLARRPQVALVDELAHTNIPGSRNTKRWQDVEELLDAGIDVVSTVNIQHLESLGDVVESITGIRQQETVPDEIVRRADQIELVDMSPQALRRRMAHGNIYKPDKVDAALSNYFRPGNLTALRELALLWVADRVDEYLQQYRSEHQVSTIWGSRERIVVGLTGGPEGRTLIRRAARLAEKGAGGEVMAVYIARSDGLTSASPKELAVQRTLVEDLGGTFHHVVGDDIPAALLAFARGVNATQIVLGVSRRRGWQYVFGPGVGATVARESGPDLDVHLITHDEAGKGRGLPVARGARLGRTRIVWGWLVGMAGPVLLALLLTHVDADLGLANDMLLFLSLTVAAALLGGLLPALASATVGSALLNWFFTPPVHTWTIADPKNIVAIAVFFAVATSVASVVDLAARRTQQAARLRAESEILSFLAGSVLRGETSLEALLERVRETFGMESVALLERASDVDPWTCAGSVGPRRVDRPEAADVDMPVGDHMALALSGRVLPAEDRRVLAAFAAQAAVVLDRRRLKQEADQAKELAEGNRIRTALLAAVSHDLRTPLAGIKASVSSLRSDDVEWSEEDQAELLAAIEEGADRLDHLVGNLLDMSRLQTGTLTPLIRDIDLDEVVPMALVGIPDPEAAVVLDIPETLPMVAVDKGLLERSVANVVENAVKYSPDGEPVTVSASVLADRVEVRVVDRGPGVPDEAKDRIFEPFQRYGDAPRGAGVGLGLAVARGFAEAMGGTLDAEDTPGGGLTMVLTLPAAPGHASPTADLPATATS
ncbi:sensor histidine kinase [Streptomyces europaeiscabiei]|uniref:histidine kinase n=1 Tax=Streptomyces europaeiscabiei TaxID=146819 RepID=A0ABU4NR72_9ACTN|nr:sensor histidine kinase KdpD [Streptomyces europaeiscabiei]MDX2757141.1 sensor histidine kinase KdpD [Streptomyces europaeiscabiei]MDX2766809.1 sensor histidine kinase KdpD [Streptomyces europaeiscabiei]MDX3547520.1 sensor histidine kinase KdpD [Streptomyces europaeiscabiei]MDX3557955.1 sensor histidine kinase KdpD [Streptomyces europaeiscabiei]MDX3584696.1 sensor histidine kinase KdpD [Streptomyces europaeiscabiei]